MNEAQKSNKPENYTKELSAFSGWFISETLDNKWSIDQLKKVLSLVHKIDDIYQSKVMPILSNFVAEMPNEVIDCLELIIKKSDEISMLHKAELKIILQSILQGNNEQAKNQASDLINYLMSKHQRYWSLRELLQEQNESLTP